MGSLAKIETTIGGFFKDLPPLSASAKESLTKAWPVIALVFGVLQLLVAWGLYGLMRSAERLYGFADELNAYVGGSRIGYSGMDRTIIYLSIAVLAADAVILLMAYPHLQKRARRGWDLLFLGALLNLAYGVLAVFIDGRGVSSLFFSLLGSAVGFYLLFQVRDKYATKKA